MRAVKRGTCGGKCRYITELKSASSDKNGYSTTQNCPKCGKALKLSGPWYATGQINGERIDKSFPTKKEAELYLSECQRAKHNGTPLPKQEVMLTWKDGKEAFDSAKMKDKTRKYYQYMLATLSREFGDKEKLIDVKPTRLLEFTKSLEEDGLSARTIAGLIGTVKRMFVLVTMYLDANDYDRLHKAKDNMLKVPKPAIDNYKDDYFTADEVRVLIAASCEQLALAIRIQIETGLRPGNVYGMRFEYIADDCTVSMPGEVMKSGRNFVTGISPVLRNDINKYALKYGYRTWLFPSPANDPALEIDKPMHDMRTAWKTAIKKTGLTGTPHKLRHSFVSILLGDDVPLYIVSSLADHADVKITYKRYGHLEPSKKQATLAEYRDKLAL